MKVPEDLSNVYIRKDAKNLLMMLANAMMLEGKHGEKFNKVSLGDAASEAIREACAARGISMTPAKIGKDAVKPVPVPVVNVASRPGKQRVK